MDFAKKDATFTAKLAPQLTPTHLELKANHDKMRVCTAAQTLSDRVATGIFVHVAYGYLPMDAIATAEVVQNMNRLFDTFNGTKEASQETAQSHAPYRTAISETSPHHDLWQNVLTWLDNVSFRHSTTGEKALPMPFVSNWKRTITATEMLWNDLKSEGRTYLPTRRLNQDPLENLFSVIRHNGGHRLQPTAFEFVPALKTALVNVVTHTGNCEKDTDRMLLDLENLFGENEESDAPEENSDNESTAGSSFAPAVIKEDSSGASTDPSTDDDFDGELFEDQAEPCVAGAMVNKLLRLVDGCKNCNDKLISTPDQLAYAFSTFTDAPNLLSPHRQVCDIVHRVLKTEETLKLLLPNSNVLRLFRQQIAPVVMTLQACQLHETSIRNRAVRYLANMMLYKIIKIENCRQKEADARLRMRNARRNEDRQSNHPTKGLKRKFEEVENEDDQHTLPEEENPTEEDLLNQPERESADLHEGSQEEESNIRRFFSSFDPSEDGFQVNEDSGLKKYFLSFNPDDF